MDKLKLGRKYSYTSVMVSWNQLKQTTDMHIAYMKNSVQRDTAKVQQMVQQ